VETEDITQICEMLKNEGVQVYKKDGAKFIQRLVAKQKAKAKMPVETRLTPRDTGGAGLYTETAWLQVLKRLHIGCNPLRFRSVA